MLGVIIFTALAFGSNEPWSVGLFEMAVTVLLLLWAIKSMADRSLRIEVPKLALPLVGLLALGLAQSLAFISSDGAIHSLSLDVEATRAATLVVFFLLASFIIATNFFATPERLGALINLLVIYGVGLAVFALIQYFTWDGQIYWVRTSIWGVAFGPFVNRNHYAGYMEMLTPLPLALIAARSVSKEAWSFYGFATAIMGLSVILSLSRGGMISLMAGLAFVALASARRARKDKSGRMKDEGKGAAFIPHPSSFRLQLKRLGMAAAIVAALAVGIFWIGDERLVNRAADSIEQLKNTPDPQLAFFARQEVWKDTLKLVGAHPILGVGLGAYEAVFPIYARHNGMFVVNYAHNDYLQVMSDGGVMGLLLAVAFLVLLWRDVGRALQSEDRRLAGLALGCSAGTFGLLVHSLFDFNLQIPSNALLFVFLSAVISRIAASVNEPKTAAARAPIARAGSLATGVEL